jgi:hypothetical protein
MARVALALVLVAVLLAACGDLLNVEPLSGDVDAGADAAVDAVTAVDGNGGTGDAGCLPVWVDSGGGVVPPGAIYSQPLGTAGIGIYVCRSVSGNDAIPGKLLPNYGCYHGDGMQEVLATAYQVLVPQGCTVAWKAAPSGVVPQGAVPCGQDSSGDLYSCRVETPDADVGELGHMGWGTNHQCVYSLSGYSLISQDFDVLTLQ